jgi:glycosyltransferase involved in cell wall biosynthesis
MANHNLEVTVVSPRAHQDLVPSVKVVEVLPKWTRPLPYSWVRNLAARQIEAVFLSQVAGERKGMAGAYIWPDPSLATIRKLRSYGIVVIREMINCHWGTSKRILDEAYERLGAAPAHGITTESVQAERESLEATDYIFACSPLVEASLVENGVPPRKILRATNGWDPARVAGSNTLFSPSTGFTAIFVGSICVRKGVHMLLRYWSESGVKGKLILLGEIEPVIKEKCADLLNRNDVVVFKWMPESELGALYRSADVFLLPTFEEGSPLVIYEACGCGLPVITTPMGAGSIVRHNCEGLVIDPYDSNGWIEAIRTLADNVELRRKMSDAARERAQSFVWKVVAARRREQILSSICAGVPSSVSQ